MTDVSERVAAGVKELVARFDAVTTRREHLAIVDEERVRQQFDWLAYYRRDLWRGLVLPAIKASWARTRGERAR